VGSTVNVSLGKFARAGIEARLGSNLRVAMVAALQHYTRRLKSSRKPVPPPRFYRDWPAQDRAGATFELQIGPQMHAVLERQARKYHLPLNQVLLHAVFVYLADLDASPEAMLASMPARSDRLN
jgi:hypothetical protein